jgi:sigma-70-like protein/DcmR-like sensory protein
VRITINEALMNVRRRRGREVSIDESSQNEAMTPLQLEDCGPNPEECYCREELQRILETSIGGLGPEYRSVFQLRDVQGFTTEETARALDLSLSAVKTRLRRARLRLRDSLDTYGVKKRSGNQAYVAERYSEAAFSAAVRKGATAIRYLGNLGMGKVPLPGRGADEVVELEIGATALALRYPFVIVCMYDVNTVSGRLMLEAGFGTHPLAVSRSALQQNQYCAADERAREASGSSQ